MSTQRAGVIIKRILDQFETLPLWGASGYDIENTFKEIVAEYPEIQQTTKGMYNFPSELCVSVNDAAAHGVPTGEPFKEGDLVKIDIILKVNGQWADAARTYTVGRMNNDDLMLYVATETARDEAIKACFAGQRIATLTHIIEDVAEQYDVTPLSALCGHTIGETLHMAPAIPNTMCFYDKNPKSKNMTLKEGQTICIEPLFTLGQDQLLEGPDGFTFFTADGKKVAHFEHTIEITRNGYKVLT